jgi:hypothetical protein
MLLECVDHLKENKEVTPKLYGQEKKPYIEFYCSNEYVLHGIEDFQIPWWYLEKLPFLKPMAGFGAYVPIFH